MERSATRGSRHSPTNTKRRRGEGTAPIILTLLAILSLGAPTTAADILYVDDDSRPGGDGRTWGRAFRYLQDALLEAEADPDITEIRVATGTYKPDEDEAGFTTPGDRTATFNLVSGLSLKGGYQGLGKPTIRRQPRTQATKPSGNRRSRASASQATQYNPNHRDIEAYETILTGDLAANDIGTTGMEENAYHVVRAVETDGAILLQGFTVTSGNADGDWQSENVSGGGLFTYDTHVLRVDRCLFTANVALGDGGGIASRSFNGIDVSRCTFLQNRAGAGGGLFFRNDSRISHARFLGNRAYLGGAVYLDWFPQSDSYLVNCLMSGNSALEGGAVFARLEGWAPSLVFENCTVVGNTADFVGGVYGSHAGLALKCWNSIFWGNSDSAGNGHNSQLQGIAYRSCIQNIDPDALVFGNTGDDPLFVDHPGPDGVCGTEDDDPRLQTFSPAIDAGRRQFLDSDLFDVDDDGNIGEETPIDLVGSTRVQGHEIDMGAYEGAYHSFLIDTEPVVVPEGGAIAENGGLSGSFAVRLASDPGHAVAVNVSKVAGDDDLSIVSGASLTFDSSNYMVPQPVVLAAALDADYLNNSATFLLEGAGLIPAELIAFEQDSDEVPPTIYVDTSAVGSADGSSWPGAFTDLQDALYAARNTASAVREIHVAKGTYHPAPPDGDRLVSFSLVDGVAMYGGFPSGGGEWADRDPESHETILSGDLNDDDVGTSGCAENSMHVVTAIRVGPATAIDGFTIASGNADSIPYDHDVAEHRGGGGIWIIDSSPVLSGCRFYRNQASRGGGVFADRSGSTLIRSCSFRQNIAHSSYYTWDGAQFYLDGGGGVSAAGHATPRLLDCELTENESRGGSGLQIASTGRTSMARCAFLSNLNSPAVLSAGSRTTISIADSVFRNNRKGAYSALGTVGLEAIGCIFDSNSNGALGMGDQTSFSLTNCILTNNTRTSEGGAIRVGFSRGVIANCTFTGNMAPNGRAVASNRYNYVDIRNCILADGGDEIWNSEGALNDGVVVYSSNIEGGWTGVGASNINLDPLFVDPAGGDFRLLPGSPCIDAGSNGAVPADVTDLNSNGDFTEPLPFDLDGMPRFIDDPDTPDTGIGMPPIVDMGAYEFQPATRFHQRFSGGAGQPLDWQNQ